MDLILGYILVLIIMGFVTYFVYKKDKKYAAKANGVLKNRHYYCLHFYLDH